MACKIAVHFAALFGLVAASAGVHAASLADALECRLPAAEAQTVLAAFGIPADGSPVQFGTPVLGYGVPILKLEALQESGSLHLYALIASHTLQPLARSAEMKAGTQGLERALLDGKNLMQAPTQVAHQDRFAPIHCEMRL